MDSDLKKQIKRLIAIESKDIHVQLMAHWGGLTRKQQNSLESIIQLAYDRWMDFFGDPDWAAEYAAASVNTVLASLEHAQHSHKSPQA